MNAAIIGYTGFVGGYLHARRQAEFTYNTSNFRDMSSRHHDLVVCAGVSAVKWMANKEPARDKEAIELLWSAMSHLKADRFVLISTVDVYPMPRGVCESSAPQEGGHPYGIHRLELEHLVMDRFPRAVVLRLPGLFGEGLRKNVLLDMMSGRLLEAIDPAASFQWYGLDRLWGDIDAALAHQAATGKQVYNLPTEPVSTGAIRDAFFPALVLGTPAATPASYDMHTENAHVFGGEGAYLEKAPAVLERMGRWLGRAPHATLVSMPC